MKRFVKEYANYKRNELKSNDLMLPEIKEELLRKLEIRMRNYERGMICTDEIMRLLSEL